MSEEKSLVSFQYVLLSGDMQMAIDMLPVQAMTYSKDSRSLKMHLENASIIEIECSQGVFRELCDIHKALTAMKTAKIFGIQSAGLNDDFAAHIQGDN